jgi:hypothetical protein
MVSDRRIADRAILLTVALGQAGQAAGLFSTMRYLGSIIGSSVRAAVLSGSAPPVENFCVLYAALLLSTFGAIITAWRLPLWIRKAGDDETGPSSSRKG